MNINKKVRDPLYHEAAEYIEQNGLYFVSQLQRQFRTGYDRTRLLAEDIISDTYRKRNLSEDVLEELFTSKVEKSFKDVIDNMSNKAIAACNHYNTYSEGVAVLSSILKKTEETEDEICELILSNDLRLSGKYDKELHENRIRFATHLLDAYRHKTKFAGSDRFINDRLLPLLNKQVRIDAIKEPLMGFLSYLFLYDDSFPNVYDNLFFSMSVSCLLRSRFRCHSAAFLLAVMPFTEDRKDKRLNNAKDRIWKKFENTSDILAELIWLKNLLHADPYYDWNKDWKNRKSIVHEKYKNSSGIRKLILFKIDTALDNSESGFTLDEILIEEALKQSPIDKQRFSHFLFFLDANGIYRATNDVVETIRDQLNAKDKNNYYLSSSFLHKINEALLKDLNKANKHLHEFRIDLSISENPYPCSEEYSHMTSVEAAGSYPIYAYMLLGEKSLRISVTADVPNQKIKSPYEIHNLLKFDFNNPAEDRMKSAYTRIDFSGLDTEGVDDMSYLFAECCNLTSLNLGNFNTRNVITMEAMFLGCTSLWEIDLKSFDYSSLKNARRMFEGCSRLMHIYGKLPINTSADCSRIIDYCRMLSAETKVGIKKEGFAIDTGREETDDFDLLEYFQTFSEEDFNEIEQDPLFLRALQFSYSCRNHSAGLLIRRYGITKERAVRLACAIIRFNDWLMDPFNEK